MTDIIVKIVHGLGSERQNIGRPSLSYEVGFTQAAFHVWAGG